MSTEVIHDVRFAGWDDEAYFAPSTPHHPFNQIFTNSAGPFRHTVGVAADREQFFGESQRLYAASDTCRRDDSPHELKLPSTRTCRACSLPQLAMRLQSSS